MRRAALALVFLSLACPRPTPAPPEPPPAASLPSVEKVQEEISQHLSQAKTAREANDYAAMIEHYAAASRLSPQNPDLKYLLSRACALAGQSDRALSLLESLAAMGLAYRADSHPDLVSLRELPRLKAIAAQMVQNQTELDRSRAFASPEGDDWLLEGIAYDSKTGRVLVSSLRKRGVFHLSESGEMKAFTAPGTPGLLGASGMVADSAKRALWVCSSGLLQVEGLSAEEKGRSALLRFHLDTGALEASYPLPADREHALGDIALTPGGDVIVSDGASGEIFRLRSGGKALETLVGTGFLRSPQGMAVAPDGKSLYVADYAAGLFRLDLASGQLRALEVAKTVPTYGIDGLVGYRGDLLAIQNGVFPPRVSRLRLSKDGNTVERAEIVERGPLAEPTLGAVVGDALYFVASSQWTNFQGADLVPAENRVRAQVRVLPLLP
jgi:sugar lactone lactonase YvrE